MRSRIPVLAVATAATLSLALAGCATGSSSAGSGPKTTISVESWRSDDIAVWNQKIIPAFEKAHPSIQVKFTPTQQDNYDSAVSAKLKAGTSGDIIACRPYANTDIMVAAGYLSNISSLSGLSSFSALSTAPWSVSGKTYCMPAASVSAGVYINGTLLKQLGLTAPTTMSDFLSDLKAAKAKGITPMAQGTASTWDLSEVLLDNLGPNYWKGEEGRQGLISGTKKVTDPEFVAALQAVADLQPYFPSTYKSLTVDDARQQFTSGKALFYVSGSYEIPQLEKASTFPLSVVAPPLPAAGDQLYVQSHPDTGFGIASASTHKAAAKTFLNWIATPAFATLYSNSLPGFLSMQKTPTTVTDSLAKSFISIESKAQLTPRLGYETLSNGKPVFELDTMSELQKMLNDPSTTSASDVASYLQAGLEKWYAPQQK